MAVPVLDILKALKKFKDLKKIRKGTLDKQPLEVLDYQIDLDGSTCAITCRYRHEGAEHTLKATHPLLDDSDVITIDGQDVEQDDVDLDFDWYPLRVVVEYRLEYVQGGVPHRMVLTARANYL